MNTGTKIVVSSITGGLLIAILLQKQVPPDWGFMCGLVAGGIAGFIWSKFSPATSSESAPPPAESERVQKTDQKVATWCQELQAINVRYSRSGHSTSDAERANRDMAAIGRDIYAEGGADMMKTVFDQITDPSTERSVGHAWRGIGSWNMGAYG